MNSDRHIQKLQSTSVSAACDALLQLGFQAEKFVIPGAKPVYELQRVVVGRARTIKYEISRKPATLEEKLIARKAVDEATAGEFLVQDASGGMVAFFGGILAFFCKKKGLAGAIVNGAARDVLEIKSMGFPVFAMGVTPVEGLHYFRPVAVNIRVDCGRVQVEAGDIIIADNDGVIVIPVEISDRVGEAAMRIVRREEAVVKSLKAGKSLVDSLK